MLETEKRMHRCCFTGHRPEKLQASEAEVVAVLRSAIQKAIDDGFKTFISGMSRGVDIWAAEVVLAFRKADPNIHLICALPHPDFEVRWHDDWKERYRAILQQSDLVRMISPEFKMSAYMERNKWMVNRTSLVIAVFNGMNGGTQSTIKYARTQGVRVWNVYNNTEA